MKLRQTHIMLVYINKPIIITIAQQCFHNHIHFSLKLKILA